MPSKPKKAPKLLATKLLKIRENLKLSQSEMVLKMNVQNEINRGKISEYERAQRIPQLHVLLAYARVAGTTMENLIDDNLELFEK